MLIPLVLTLFPIHALGLRTIAAANKKKKKKKKKQQQNDADTEFVAYDSDRDGKYFTSENQEAGLRMKLNIPLDSSQPALSVLGGDRKNNKVLFAMLYRDEIIPGWMGARIKSAFNGVNCVIVPLPGAAPLCACIATTDMKEGDALVRGIKPPDAKLLNECLSILAEEYNTEISELKQYIEMACKAPEATTQTKSGAAEELGPFHQINSQYPGIKQLYQNPDIYQIDGFLTDDECERIISKATPHLTTCIIKNESTGAVEQDPSRTSYDANLPQVEVPSIVSKLTKLAFCDANQLEILQVLRYTQGQEFKPHTDGYEGAYCACGFENANRLVTIFCYLNDVAKGGCTNFPELSVEIRPKKGSAVVHFPSDTKLRGDERTVHQGLPAIDEKFLLATWVWSKPRTVKAYNEENLPSMSDDLI